MTPTQNTILIFIVMKYKLQKKKTFYFVLQTELIKAGINDGGTHENTLLFRLV